jgi:hypothetical protein
VGDELTPEDPAGADAPDAATAEDGSEHGASPSEAALGSDEPVTPARSSETGAAADEAQATMAAQAAVATVSAQAELSEEDFASSDQAPLTRRERWQRRTATGAILSGLALGFQQVFEAPKEDVSIVMETSGTPPRDLPVEAEFDEMVPRRSIVKIRPWLLPEPATQPEESEDAEAATDADAAADPAAEAGLGETAAGAVPVKAEHQSATEATDTTSSAGTEEG